MQVISLCHLGLFVTAACLELIRQQNNELSVKLLGARSLQDGQSEQVLACILNTAINVDLRSAISWLVDGAPLVDDEMHRIVGNTLTLLTSSDSQRSFTSAAKAYQCLANLPGQVALISTYYFPELSMVPGGSSRDDSLSVFSRAGSIAFVPCPFLVNGTKPYFLLNNITAPLLLDSKRFSSTVYGLHVFNASQSDSGLYKCCFRKEATALCGAPTKVLIVDGAPRLEVDTFLSPFTTYIFAEEGESIVMQCVIRNKNPARVRWFRRPCRNGQEALPAKWNITNGNLLLPNVTKHDQGIYSCSEGQKSALFALRVIEPFLIRIGGKENDWSTYNLTCESSGRPNAVLRWYLNGAPLLETSANVISAISENGTNPRLIISVSNPPLRGAYQCLARFGSSSVQATLLIPQRRFRKSRSAMPTDPLPIFTQRPTNVTAQLGSEVFMVCMTKNADEVKWLLNGTLVKPDDERIILIGSGSLQIRNFSTTDQGLYTCVISNKYGQDSSQATLEMELPYVPIFSVDDPFDRSNDATVNRNSNLCKSTWLNMRLEPPEVNAMSNSSVLIRWRIPSDEHLPCQPVQFRIQYKRVVPLGGDASEWETLTEGLPPTARNYVLNNLEPGNTYRFRYAIVLRNLQPITSRTSKKLVLSKTPAVLPPRKPPELMTVVSKWSDAAQVKWELPYEEGTPVDGFTLQYRQVYGGVPVPYQNETIFGGEAREHMLDHLLPATPYEVRLFAYNSGGSSPPSASMIASTLTLDGMQATINFFPESVESSKDHVSSPNPSTPSQATAYSIYTTAGAIFGVIVLCNIVIITSYIICRWKNSKKRQRRSNTARSFNDTSYRLFRESTQRSRWQQQQQALDDDLALQPVAVNHYDSSPVSVSRLGAFSTGCLKTVEHEPLMNNGLSPCGRFLPNRGTL
ncbi:I-set and fn3 and Ig 2 domain containing protein [Trichuris trichiura]|uniref:I-set and fn3 and Ig 2 domain containing protein n=1 Tax=Trichuris trichiura TaxID=36087 RepID=A0A077ZH54_TRITR|nr:I-set and fn3 and Ig 2 domain containing protein [Trichuris trichiura]